MSFNLNGNKKNAPLGQMAEINVTPLVDVMLVLLIVFLTQFWIFASLIISTKQILNLKSNFKAFGVVFLSFLIIAFLSVAFIMSRMNALPVSNIS